MANINLNPVRAREVAVIPLAVTISIAAGVPSINTIGVSVAKVATGIYELTLAESYVKLLSCIATVEAASAIDLKAQIKSADVVTTRKIQIRVLAVATDTDITNGKIHCLIMLKNSSV